jgi:hypothetical protein
VILAGEDAEAARQRLVEIRETIGREVEDPEFWTGQIDTAYRVFVETDAGRGEVRD